MFSFFILICKIECFITKNKARDLIFEVLIQSKILERLDLSDNFWKYFGICEDSLKKKVCLYEIVSISNANMITIAVNPKEYFEKFKGINKKLKVMRKDAPRMKFECFADRTMYDDTNVKLPRKMIKKGFKLGINK